MMCITGESSENFQNIQTNSLRHLNNRKIGWNVTKILGRLSSDAYHEQSQPWETKDLYPAR